MAQGPHVLSPSGEEVPTSLSALIGVRDSSDISSRQAQPNYDAMPMMPAMMVSPTGVPGMMQQAAGGYIMPYMPQAYGAPMMAAPPSAMMANTELQQQ